MQPGSLDSEVGMQCSQGHWTVRWGCSAARVIGQGGGDAVQPGSLDSEVGMIFHCVYDMSGCRLITAKADKTIKMYKEDETVVRREM